jgi:hypothetical protein
MTHTIRIPKPRDPLAGMIASYRSAYARKWRVPVPEASEPADRAPAASLDDPEEFDRVIRSHLFWARVR